MVLKGAGIFTAWEVVSLYNWLTKAELDTKKQEAQGHIEAEEVRADKWSF